MNTWIKQANSSNKRSDPGITVRRNGFALNVAFVCAANVMIGDHAEVYLSDCGKKIGIKFFKEKNFDRFCVTQDGGSRSRCKDLSRANALISCGKIINSSQLKDLVGSDKSKLTVSKEENDIWIAQISNRWEYVVAEREPKDNEIGVYRYLSDGEVVYIGMGRIKQRIKEIGRQNWLHDSIEYMLLDEGAARREEGRLLSGHRNTFGRLPIYNRISGSKK